VARGHVRISHLQKTVIVIEGRELPEKRKLQRRRSRHFALKEQRRPWRRGSNDHGGGGRERYLGKKQQGNSREKRDRLTKPTPKKTEEWLPRRVMSGILVQSED